MQHRLEAIGIRPSDFPRDQKYRDPTTPPFLEEGRSQAIAHVFSYADAKRVQLNVDSAFSHDARAWLPPEQHNHLRWHFMWAADPGRAGRHDVLRGLVADWFKRRAVTDMSASIIGHARALRQSIVEKGTGEFNLASEFAYRLSLQTICSLVGIPLSREKWLQDEMDVVARTPDVAQLETRHGLESYFWEIVAKRAVAEPRDELIDQIIAGWRTGSIEDRELLAFFFGLAAAGMETTGTSIVDAFTLPSEFGKLDYIRAHLDDDQAMDLACNEILRYGSPFPTTPGIFAAKQVQLGTLDVPRGSQVHVHLAAANRSPDVNAGNTSANSPGELDLRRSPNRHMSFGLGLHYCLGDHLTRHEMTIALRELLRGLPDLTLDESKPFHRYAGIVDGVTEAHFTFDQKKAEELLG